MATGRECQKRCENNSVLERSTHSFFYFSFLCVIFIFFLFFLILNLFYYSHSLILIFFFQKMHDWLSSRKKLRVSSWPKLDKDARRRHVRVAFKMIAVRETLRNLRGSDKIMLIVCLIFFGWGEDGELCKINFLVFELFSF